MKYALTCVALLAITGCNRPAPTPNPERPPAPQAGAAAARLHAPLDKARAVEHDIKAAADTRNTPTEQAASTTQ